MPWFKTDDKFYTHPKVLSISWKRKQMVSDREAALSLWLLAGLWATDNLTDGWVPPEHVEGYHNGRGRAQLLCGAGLWHEVSALVGASEGVLDMATVCQPCRTVAISTLDVSHGYLFHGWDGFQPTRASVMAERLSAAERQRKRRSAGRKGGDPPVSRRDSHRDNGVTHTVTPEPVTAMSHRDSDACHGVTHGPVTAMSHDPRSRTPKGLRLRDDDVTKRNARDMQNESSSSKTFTPDLTNPRCEKHADLPLGVWNPDPCGACARVAQWAKEETSKRASAPSVVQLDAEKRRRAIAACKQCDEAGWLLDSNGEPFEPSVRHHPLVTTQETR